MQTEQASRRDVEVANHAARSDVSCIVHAHPPVCISLTQSDSRIASCTTSPRRSSTVFRNTSASDSPVRAAGGDADKLRALTHEEAERLSDHLSPVIVERAWEYYPIAAAQRPLGDRFLCGFGPQPNGYLWGCFTPLP